MSTGSPLEPEVLFTWSFAKKLFNPTPSSRRPLWCNFFRRNLFNQALHGNDWEQFIEIFHKGEGCPDANSAPRDERPGSQVKENEKKSARYDVLIFFNDKNIEWHFLFIYYINCLWTETVKCNVYHYIIMFWPLGWSNCVEPKRGGRRNRRTRWFRKPQGKAWWRNGVQL